MISAPHQILFERSNRDDWARHVARMGRGVVRTGF